VHAIHREVKAKHPDFLFVGEVYWDMEWQLQQLGFDFIYDKVSYPATMTETIPVFGWSIQCILHSKITRRRLRRRYICVSFLIKNVYSSTM
jgi:hypothetical protein